MITDSFINVYNKFKLNFYRNIFKGFDNQDSSLTPTETICIEVVALLNEPTLSDLCEFMDVSQPNMSYRVNSLVKKGYISKRHSENDKREVYLEVTEKYQHYRDIKEGYINRVLVRAEDYFTKEEMQIFERMLDVFSNKIMP